MKSRRRPSWLCCDTRRSEIASQGNSGEDLPVNTGGDWRRILPGLIVSALALAAVLYFADLRRLVEALRLANYSLALLGVFISLLWLAVRGFAWRALMQGGASYSKVFLTLNEGYLINNLLPLRLGEIARAFLLSRKTELSFWQVLSSILIERSMDIALAVGVLLISLPFVVGGSWARQAALGAGLLIALVFTALYLLARYRSQALRAFQRLGSRWPLLLRLGGRAASAFFEGLAVLTNARAFWRASGWMALNWGIAILQYYLILAAYFPNPRPLWAMFSLGVSALGVAAPSSPGAVGVLELSVVGALALFSLDVSTALAFAFTLHIIQVLTTGAIGGYALLRDGETLVGLYQRMRKFKETESPLGKE